MPRHKQSDPTSIKTSVIRLRVTEAEAQLFKANAAAAGCKSVSEYIRMRCISDGGTIDSGSVDKTAATASDKSTAVKKAKRKVSE